MSLTPKVRRILVPPPAIPSKNSPVSTQLAAVIDLATFCPKQTTAHNASTSLPLPPPIFQRHISPHPVMPWIAYILESTSTNMNKVVVVQNTLRPREMIFSLHWMDLAAAVYGETDAKKLPAAAKSLGSIISLQFIDNTTLHWSRLGFSSNSWQSLAIQTEKRVLLLNLRQGPDATQVLYIRKSTLPDKHSAYQRVLAHVCDRTVGATPSSNVLALSEHWLLVGCTDGSMKCYDWKTTTIVKKIKGLGKGDCVVQLLSANPYSAKSDQPKRILTVTKRGSVYLIELEFGSGTIDIRPPTARFQIGSELSNLDAGTMEHCLVSYCAHNDRLQWLVPGNKDPVLHVWNFDTLDRKSQALIKPDPTLIIHFPAVSASSTTSNMPLKEEKEATGGNLLRTSISSSQTVTVLSGLVHPAFSEDTVVSVTLTETGDLCLHGATASLTNTTTSTVQATPVTLMNVKQSILHEALESHEDDLDCELKVHAVASQPLGHAAELIVATNWGLVILELPAYTNSLVESESVSPASRYLHFGAGLGSLGKSTITVRHSAVTYGTLDVLTVNPVGKMEPKNPVVLYESPAAQYMPPEFYKRPFRNAPRFMQSPSGVYICLFWPCEYRYEVLHTASLLQQVGQIRAGSTPTQLRNPVVATGTGVCDFCWVSDDDVFAILHAEDLQAQAAMMVPKQSGESGSYNMKMIGAGAMGVANLATSVVAKTATNIKGATNAANMTVGVTTKAFRSGAKGVTKGVKKSFGIFGGKKKKADAEGSIMTADDDEDDDESSSAAASAAAMAMQASSVAELEALRASAGAGIQTIRQRYVELRGLEAVEAQSVELSAGIPAATCSSLGELALRGGNRNPPTVIFGGPVICVASRSEDDREGYAHFYTLKSDSSEHRASSYQSAGPTLPYPDFVAWDDDGRLCAIVVESRVAVYLSSEPDFCLLGTVRIVSPTAPTALITTLKFVHGALFCCTYSSVHCILLGDLSGGICRLDSYLLAATSVPLMLPASSKDDDTTFAPTPVPLPLVQPSVMGYQSGSLLVSSLRGVLAIPLNSQLMRIGLFLASGQVERATKWFDAVDRTDHEALANFLERRGYPELAMQLDGLSLETIVDLSMRYGYVDRLEDVVESYGVSGLRAIDMGRGLSTTIFGPEDSDHNVIHSVVVCVGAYLLAHGRVELTRRLATECLRSGDEGKKDAFFLGTLLLPVDESDATRLIHRAVDAEDASDEWLMGNYVRDYVLNNDTST